MLFTEINIFMLYSVDESRPSTGVLDDSDAIVNSNGSVQWLTSALIKSACEVDVTLYPFDTQYCDIRYGSWTYSSQEMNITCANEKGEIGFQASNGEWNLIDIPCAANQTKYACCPNSFADITYTVVIQRKPMFYIYNLAFPCVLLCIIGILVFCLPSESGEKVSLSVTLLLSMVVFMLAIMNNVPATSDVVPLLGMKILHYC